MPSPKPPVAIFWFRRDLRLHDNNGLSHALSGDLPVLPLFIFDCDILDQLEDRDDARVTFIHREVMALQKQFVEAGGTLLVRYGKPIDVWKELLKEYQIIAAYTNHDYEQYAINRDQSVRQLLESQGAALHTFKDQVIFEKQEILSGEKKPYTVFTPYSKRWLSTLTDAHLNAFPSEKKLNNLLNVRTEPVPSLEEMSFIQSEIPLPDRKLNVQVLQQYAEERNYPAKQLTTRMGVYLRFGTVSIRDLAKMAQQHSPVWLNELIWRDFYMQILANFPHVEKHPFKPAYEHIQWRNNEAEFEQWCAGKTGYPIVDAGMRQLNQTGYMHNRVRMIVASFLIKHLLIDWRWGDAYFARKLLDYELASNNGGWQWAAGSGTDAAPYFRVFNPATQAKKFDQASVYIRQWVPEYGTDEYPKPIVNHEEARKRAIDTYQKALRKEPIA